MPRAKDGTRRKNRRKAILQFTKGFKGRRKNLFRSAKDASARALQYAYRDRRTRKRFFRRLWISRISAACRIRGINYSRFMHAVIASDIALDRKALAHLAAEDPSGFDGLVASLEISA